MHCFEVVLDMPVQRRLQLCRCHRSFQDAIALRRPMHIASGQLQDQNITYFAHRYP